MRSSHPAAPPRAPRPVSLARIVPPLFGLAIAACSSGADETAPPDGGGSAGKSTAAPDLSGKADGAPAVDERGRLEIPAGGEALQVQRALNDRVLAWRLRSYGDTTLRLVLRASSPEVDPYLAVDGPLPEASGTVVGFSDDVDAEDRTAVLEVTLPAAGAYRVQAGTYGLFHQQASTPGDVTLEVTCLAHCAPKEWSLAEVLADVRQNHGDATVRALIEQGIGALFTDAETAAAVRAQADAALAGPTLPEAFPVVPLAAIGTAQALLERESSPVPPPAGTTFTLDALLTEDCHPARSALSPVHASLPELQTGSAPDYTYDDCRLQRAQDFARVLNNLALENGSAVVQGPTRYETIEDVFTALLDSGHHIVVQNNRYFADFLGLSYRGAPVKAPVWVDTGIPLPAGGTLRLPAPHSHHTVIVDGPILDATLMFYMGVSGGVSFRAVESDRPRWSGERTLYDYDSERGEADRDAIVQLMVVAGELRRTWTEAGAGLPALGYGQLGVCNDSTAVLEYTAEGTVTIFPLAHPASDAAQAGLDRVHAALAALPSDLAGFEPTEALGRIATTLAFDPPETLPFPGLAAELATLR